VKIEKIVPPEVFYPAPEVESALVSFKLKDDRVRDAKLLKRCVGIIKAAFLQRRKQMGKVLASSYGKELMAKAMEQADLAWEIRPDKVTPEQFLHLATILEQLSQG
jgi:16S rRNA (adenine1518-N6/adenine1519-N6)-dimethyltransferase